MYHFTFRIIISGLFLLLFSAARTDAQDFFRFRAEFSIKEKTVGAEQGTLVTGTVYYDKNTRKLLHEVQFPEREQWLVQDTVLFRIIADTVNNRRTVAPFGEYSVYHMILNQQLHDFGLAKGGFVLSEVEDAGNGSTVSTWSPPEQAKKLMGNIVIMQEQKRTTAIAFYSPEGKVLSKFYFKDYQIIDGLPTPCKIYQIFFATDGSELNRIITFKNVLVNEATHDEKYDYRLPDAHR